MRISLTLPIRDQLTLCDVTLDDATPRIIERTRFEAPPGASFVLDRERDLAAWSDNTGFVWQRGVTSANPGAPEPVPLPELRSLNVIIYCVTLRDGVLFAGGSLQHQIPGMGFFAPHIPFYAIDLDRAPLQWELLPASSEGRGRVPHASGMFELGTTLCIVDDVDSPTMAHRFDVSQPRAPRFLPPLGLARHTTEYVMQCAAGERAVALLWQDDDGRSRHHHITLHDRETLAHRATLRCGRQFSPNDIAFAGDRLLVAVRREGVLIVDDAKVHALLDLAQPGGAPVDLPLHEHATCVSVPECLVLGVRTLPTRNHCIATGLDAHRLSQSHVVDLTGAR